MDNKLRLSEKVLSIRVNNGLYEYLVKYAKDNDTTISEITRQALELFYSVVPYGEGKGTIQDKNIFDMVLDMKEGSINYDLKGGELNKELIERFGELHLTVMRAIEEHKKTQKELNKRLEVLETINGMIADWFLKGMEKLRTKVLNQFENETQLEGSSVPSSLVWSGAPQRAQGKVSIEV